jgi:hypothetical protein
MHRLVLRTRDLKKYLTIAINSVQTEAVETLDFFLKKSFDCFKNGKNRWHKKLSVRRLFCGPFYVGKAFVTCGLAVRHALHMWNV